ncbi:MAG: cytochrome c oxidase subunit I [Actinobacteria bacterium]|uniref:cytochrome-c oxidase n=1 Tax=freshwater metagenome TaxID=449393 RepID=A0A6J5YAQ3_9ZZZZ|nr:cytochrome c oxidase subunit I [Actinomycetota bacterium]MTA77607.1 cytochrome c oxidase subunit I [Actinomycetota bacterium]
MAIIEAPSSDQLALPSGAVVSDHKPTGAFTRPSSGATGWKSWLTTVDHKKIGIMYGATALVFLLIGGFEAILIRVQLWSPRGTLLSANTYNQVFTMHGTTMVFLVVMPIGAAFANYLMPLQIGARDVAYPRINAYSYWMYLFGGIFLNTSWLLGGGADGGWFNYAPNNGILYSPSHGIDFWNMGLLITGIASLAGAVNLIVTVLNMRAPGMSLMRMPIFTWMTLVTQFLLLFAIPVLTVAQVLLMMDRTFDANFFNVAKGANPLLWEHLFWIFGHPEVYLMILPAFGLVSDMLPVFSRKPIFGYPFIVFSGVAIGFMGWGVWAHHMFVSGIGPISVTAFSLTTMFIAVPTGVKILNWTATMWGGKLQFTAPMLFSIGLVTMFTIGGLSGVTHSVAPADTQQTDTYYIVAHFHYVLFGGAFFGFIGGFYFYWSKVFGYMLNEKVGKANFWLMLLGFNLTFAPMHILGLQGMSRRIYTYDAGYGFDLWNKVATVGAFVLASSVFLFIFNIFYSRSKAKSMPPVSADPWDARTIEWMIPSPVPEYNFDPIPTVTRVDDFWYRKYGETNDGKLVRIAETDDVIQKLSDGKHIHLPSPSYWPIVSAFGMPIIGYGLIFNLWLCLIGGIIVVGGIYGWALEPADDPDAAHDDHDPADHGPDDDSAAAAITEGADAGDIATEKEPETVG